MDDKSRPLGKVLPLPQSPDAIELRHLRSFVAVADELNFGRAAARLFISQPALSRQIRALERLVGCDLLRRTTHRVELTLAGEAFLERARRLLGDLDEAVVVTRSVGGELADRITSYWGFLADPPTSGSAASAGSASVADLQEFRDGLEALHAQFAPPAEVEVRPINAGGVPSLLVSPPDRPVTALHLHGGAFVMGSAFGYRALAGALAVAAGTGVLVPEYRLAPEHPFPAALEDALRAYLWLVDACGDPRRVTLCGDSSGGHLAVSLAITLIRRGIALPGRMVLLSPAADLARTELPDPPDGSPPVVSVDQLRLFARLYLDGHPIDDPVVSPLTADLAGLPPMLIQAGAQDPVVDDARRLAAHAREHGVEVALQLYPVAAHLFHLFWSFLPEAADAIAEAGRFIHPADPADRTA
jgi:acetyl esterase/lipase